MIEVGTVGFEGVVSAAAYLGLPSSPNEVFMQVGGQGLRIEAAALAREARADGPLRDLLVRYHAFFLYQVSQSVACNGLHAVGPRCCPSGSTTRPARGRSCPTGAGGFASSRMSWRRWRGASRWRWRKPSAGRGSGNGDGDPVDERDVEPHHGLLACG